MIELPRILEDGNYKRRIKPISCSITQSLQPLSIARLELDHETDINPIDWVRISAPDGSIGYYRVVDVSVDASTGQKSAYLEHGACTLNDVVILDGKRKALSYKDTITNLVTTILGSQEDNRWTVGTIESTDVVYIEPGGSNLLTALLTMMESIPDYQLEFNQYSEIDWRVEVKARQTVPVCEGRLSRNLKSCDVSYSTSNIVTRVYADGLPNGKMDSDNVSLYGVRAESMTINESLTQAQKNRIASAYLAMHDHPALGVSISAVELSQITGLEIDAFKVGTVCRIVVPWLDIIEREVITEKVYSDPFGDPESISITLANAIPDLSLSVAAITGGGGGKGGGGVKGAKDRFSTRIEQEKEYLRLIATDTEWDEMEEHGTVTAYGQIVITSTSIQSVISNVGQDGTVTAASIALAINEQGSNATINADHISLNAAQGITLDGFVQATGTSFTIAGGVMGDGTLECDTIECNVLEIASASGSISTPVLNINTGGVLKIYNDSLELDDQEVTWQSKRVVTAVGVTMPTISVGGTHTFLYSQGAGQMTPSGTASGKLVTQYSAGSVSPTTEVIYYLGRSGSNS